ncbi:MULTISPECIES: ABC transporter permease [unclassified Clostridium]|uniref:ABC transporter permease n=1 Tax=unclassified Clostridium TaxID=2614128 RepID=UPI0025BDFF2E|nr:ABC transporter permease [Clostridium sp.]MCI6691044.1 ABC transporter permease [Clostridium sp.]MDY2632161.1 ABC transporter permease [Clostridium sp.]MDY4251294.1 ABC transporter permease [Clostridium sp.]
MDLIINVLEQGLLFGVVAIGVYITYKILDFPDLSVDGTYPLGAAICAALLVKDVNPWLAVLVATIGGALAGLVTALLNVKLKITNLMSGILVMIGLYSVNLMVMGQSNIPLFNTKNVFTGKFNIITIIVVVLIIKISFDFFLKTKLGNLLIAVGDNEQLVTSLGINKNNIKILGLMISNGLVALSGALTAQYQGFSDASMGTGVVVMGLAAVIIGASIFKKMSFMKYTTISIFGAIIYKLAIALALKFGLNPNYLKLMTAVIVIIALSLNSGVFKFKGKRRKAKSTEIKREGGDVNAKDSSIAQSL